MIEIVDNGIQLGVILLCGLYAAVVAFRRGSQSWFLLACFYGALAQGLVYWFLFLIFRADTPRVGSISMLSWIAGFLFLIVLQGTVSTPEERADRPLWAWIAPAFSAVMYLYFFRRGDYILNLVRGGCMGMLGYFALRGLRHGRRSFHMAVLAYFAADYALWIVSPPLGTDTLDNPCFWFDFALTASLFALLPALRKAAPR